MRRMLIKADFRSRGICKTTTTLNRWIKNEGFPPGFMLGRNRVWFEDEVEAWLASRPATKRPLRGIAKRITQDASVGEKQAALMRAARGAA